MLFDWLVVGQVMGSNPAAVVRGPRHVVKRGKTPVLSPEEARQLFQSIPTDSLVGLRDRALIGVLIYSFARISAALAMRVEDYFPQGKRWWLRLHEKGGQRHEMPVHHTLEEYLARISHHQPRAAPLVPRFASPFGILPSRVGAIGAHAMGTPCLSRHGRGLPVSR
jgi:integrase